ncbi:MAG TPA: DinB family protein [Mucilaginibacter sp.]|nr:DinB family protein [Mucilaginibacter sp.]
MSLYPSLISRLKTQHESLPVIIAKLNQTQLEQNPVPGKWSIKDNIAHLACYQPMFIARMHRIEEQDGVTFDRYSADIDPEFPGWQSRNVDDLLNQIAIDRETIINLITSLQPQQLSRTGIHPKYGKLTMTEWAEFFLLHEAHHLFTIFQLVER